MLASLLAKQSGEASKEAMKQLRRIEAKQACNGGDKTKASPKAKCYACLAFVLLLRCEASLAAQAMGDATPPLLASHAIACLFSISYLGYA
jgi:hypothetical protein